MVSAEHVAEFVARENPVCGASEQDFVAVADMGVYYFAAFRLRGRLEFV